VAQLSQCDDLVLSAAGSEYAPGALFTFGLLNSEIVLLPSVDDLFASTYISSPGLLYGAYNDEFGRSVFFRRSHLDAHAFLDLDFTLTIENVDLEFVTTSAESRTASAEWKVGLYFTPLPSLVVRPPSSAIVTEDVVFTSVDISPPTCQADGSAIIGGLCSSFFFSLFSLSVVVVFLPLCLAL
jgi:hypothetical protein